MVNILESLASQSSPAAHTRTRSLWGILLSTKLETWPAAHSPSRNVLLEWEVTGFSLLLFKTRNTFPPHIVLLRGSDKRIYKTYSILCPMKWKIIYHFSASCTKNYLSQHAADFMTQLKTFKLDDMESQGNSFHSSTYLSKEHMRHYCFLNLD